MAVLLIAAAPGAAAVPPSIDTWTSLAWTDDAAGEDFFDGELRSPERRCLRRRDLILHRKRRGPDQRVASARSDRLGVFRIELEDPGSDQYYLEIKDKRLPTLTCGGGRTGNLEIVDLEDV